MAQIIWSSIAEDDLNMIYEHIALDSPFYASNVIDKIWDRTSILETQSRIGRIVPEFGIPSIRELIEGNYRIIYEIIHEDLVSVLHIYHRARLLTKH